MSNFYTTQDNSSRQGLRPKYMSLLLHEYAQEIEEQMYETKV